MNGEMNTLYVIDEIKSRTGIDIRHLAKTTHYSVLELIEQVRSLERMALHLRVQADSENLPLIFSSALNKATATNCSVEDVIKETLEPLAIIEKTKLPKDYQVTLVASPNLNRRYERLYQLSVQDSLEAFNLHCNWYEIKDTGNTWMYEIYILSKGEEDLGFFTIQRIHLERSANLTAFIKKEFRKKGLMSGCLQFIANRVFNEWGFIRIAAIALSTNKTGIKFYSKYMVYEGKEREVSIFNGAQVDRNRYSLLRREVEWCDENKIFTLMRDKAQNFVNPT